MVSRNQRHPIVLQKVRKQRIRFWQEIIYKSLIPTATFGISRHYGMFAKSKD